MNYAFNSASVAAAVVDNAAYMLAADGAVEGAKARKASAGLAITWAGVKAGLLGEKTELAKELGGKLGAASWKLAKSPFYKGAKLAEQAEDSRIVCDYAFVDMEGRYKSGQYVTASVLASMAEVNGGSDKPVKFDVEGEQVERVIPPMSAIVLYNAMRDEAKADKAEAEKLAEAEAAKRSEQAEAIQAAAADGAFIATLEGVTADDLIHNAKAFPAEAEAAAEHGRKILERRAEEKAEAEAQASRNAAFTAVITCLASGLATPEEIEAVSKALKHAAKHAAKVA